MHINNAWMCTNVTRGSQYIVMHNTGVMDLEISEQIDIMKVDDVLNISREYSYIHSILDNCHLLPNLVYGIFLPNYHIEYLS